MWCSVIVGSTPWKTPVRNACLTRLVASCTTCRPESVCNDPKCSFLFHIGRVWIKQPEHNKDCDSQISMTITELSTETTESPVRGLLEEWRIFNSSEFTFFSVSWCFIFFNTYFFDTCSFFYEKAYTKPGYARRWHRCMQRDTSSQSSSCLVSDSWMRMRHGRSTTM